MKQLFSTLLLLIGITVGTQVSAQTRTTTTTTTAPKATLAPKQMQLCRTWQIKSIEAWSVAHDATDAEKKDLFWLGSDGNCRFTWLGVSVAGKWTIDKSNTWMKITAADGSITNIKVNSVSDSELVIDYKDKDDQHNIVTYNILVDTTTSPAATH